ncbi:MAG: signal peptide peptidase SppA [Bacteroidetes bacterium GWF2_49_14]|nr:MAG: signal peptide peptidase SppA [Bacteroidetes bacterium GWF2_49_14]
MKGFFKYFLASFLAVCVALLLLTVIGLGSISALMSAGPGETHIKSNSVLVLTIGQGIGERTIDSPLESYDMLSMQALTTIGIYDITQNLKKAAKDPNIKGILIKSGIISPGFSMLDEIREALTEFKKSGKFIYSYADMYSQGSYYLASIADGVYMNPEGLLEFRGLRSDVMFFKKALEKFGVDVQVIREGRYKSAVEPFLLESMSEASREQISAYINTVWNRILTSISESRGISVSDLNQLADGWVARTPKGAISCGLVDSLLYKDQIDDLLRSKSGLASGEKLRSVSMKEYMLVPDPDGDEYTPDRIAIIYGTGSIAMVSTGNQSIGTELAGTFAKARKDNKIKAIVFRINSPGGDALASEIIRREVELTAKVKPVIVSMGNVAGSGGYWIAAPATKIVAGHGTVTGSIGAFGLVPNLEKLLTDKIGITFDGVETNRLAGTGSIFRPMTDEEKAVFDDQLSQTYGHFLDIVAASRKMTREGVDSIGQGRIWAGITAKEVGLIDETGGLQKAITLAAGEAKLTNWRIRELPALKNPLNEIISQITGQKSPAETYLSAQLPVLQDIQDLIRGGRIQARVPFRIDLN